MEVAVVGRGIRASRHDDVERAQGSDERSADQGRPSGGVNTVGNCMTRLHEGGEALFDIDGGSSVSHADASFLEEFELSSLASNKRDGRVGADGDGRRRNCWQESLCLVVGRR